MSDSRVAASREEIAAWVGDEYGRLTVEQVTELMAAAEQISERYPDPDDRDEREAALTVAFRILTREEGVVADLAEDLARGRAIQLRALAGLRQAAMTLIPAGDESEAGFARSAGLDRMAVRGWLGKR